MLLRALFLRPLVRAPLRCAVTIAGVAAGVAALVATLAASRAALAALREGVGEIAGRTRLEVSRPGGVEDAVAGLLRELARDATLLPIVEEIALLRELDDVVRLIGVDPLVEPGARPIEVDALTGDLLLRTLRGEGAWIAESLARQLNLEVGDALELDVRSRAVRLEILGTFRPRDRSSAWGRVVLVDVALAQELVARVGRLDRIELVPRAGVDIEALRARAEALLPPDIAVAAPARRAAETAGMVRSLEFNLTALSGISLCVAAVLVATTLATSVVQRRSTIALLRSLGASELAIVRALLLEAASIGSLGALLGVAAGFLAARSLVASMRATVATVVAGVPESPIRFDAGQALAGFGVGLVVSLAAAVLPVLEARRTPPIQALAGERPEVLSARSRRLSLGLAALFAFVAAELVQAPPLGGLPVAALAGALALLGALFALCGPAVDLLGRLGSHARFLHGRAIAFRLACAALAAGRRRAAWAAGAVGVAVALAVSIATLVTSFRATVVAWTDRGLGADLFVRPRAPPGGIPIGRLDPALVVLLQDEFGPGVVDPFHSAPASFEASRITLGGAALDVARHRANLPFRADPDELGTRAARDPHAVFQDAWQNRRALVNEPFAVRFGLGEGDTVVLDSGGQRIEREIAGVFYDYGDSQGLVVIDRADFLEIHPGDGPREIALFLPADVEPADAEQRIAARTGAQFRFDVLEKTEVRAHVLAVFDRTFAITRALQSVAAAVAVVAVLSVLFALVHERRADLGLLAALGASRAQIGLQVCLQSGLLGLVGALGGALTGLLIGLVLVKVVNLQSFGWTLEFRRPWDALAATSAGVVGACVLAGIAPAISAARASLHELIRDE